MTCVVGCLLMRRARCLLFCSTVGCSSLACSLGVGASGGVTVDTAGNLGVMARAHSRAGGRNTNDEREVAVFWLPQLSVGGGWDLSRGGPRLELGIPFVGFARVPHGPGWVYGMQTHFRAEFAWPSHGSMRTVFGPTLSLLYGRVLYHERVPKMYPDWPDGWIYEVAGWSAEGGLHFSTENEETVALGAFAMGPWYEYQRFFYMGVGATDPQGSGDDGTGANASER